MKKDVSNKNKWPNNKSRTKKKKGGGGGVQCLSENMKNLLNHSVFILSATIIVSPTFFTWNSSNTNAAAIFLSPSTEGTGLTLDQTPKCSNMPRCTCNIRRREAKFQALVYHTLPPTTAIADYAVGLKKLSANGQFFVDAHKAVSLEQLTQIISGVSFITAHVAYTSANKPKLFESRWNFFFFLPGADTLHVHMHAWILCCFHSLIST